MPVSGPEGDNVLGVLVLKGRIKPEMTAKLFCYMEIYSTIS